MSIGGGGVSGIGCGNSNKKVMIGGSSSDKKKILTTHENSVGKKMMGKKKPNTNSNLYSMIYQNRTKNLVSSYLKNIDTKV